MTMIAFIGSVFSPYYAWAGRRDPEDHVALNICLYGPDRNYWSMTERGRGALKRDGDRLQIGPSTLTWSQGRLVVEVDEVSVPRPPAQWLPRRLTGRIVVEPVGPTDSLAFAIDGVGRHVWTPVAPCARAQVEFRSLGLGWQGEAYLDGNHGSEALEHGFRRWDWARGTLPDGSVAVLYDSRPLRQAPVRLGLAFGPQHPLRGFALPPARPVGRGFWGVDRHVACDPDASPILLRTLEDGPFYLRSVVRTVIEGCPIDMVHESFSGSRFGSRLVKAMLPFRMPRRRR